MIYWKAEKKMIVKERAVGAVDWSLEAASTAAAAVPVQGAGRIAGVLQNTRANDAPVVVVILAAAAFLAVVASIGFAAAWAYFCAQKGLYPALDQPPIDQGGTWKLYCRK
ncbi:hypothetical protein GCM10009605_28920 [Nocardiopsis composta]